jgi:hypothetical protein
MGLGVGEHVDYMPVSSRQHTGKALAPSQRLAHFPLLFTPERQKLVAFRSNA